MEWFDLRITVGVCRGHTYFLNAGVLGRLPVVVEEISDDYITIFLDIPDVEPIKISIQDFFESLYHE